jgi:hypothetical protein
MMYVELVKAILSFIFNLFGGTGECFKICLKVQLQDTSIALINHPRLMQV